MITQLLIFCLGISGIPSLYFTLFGDSIEANLSPEEGNQVPAVNDPNLKVESPITLSHPTTMAFLAPNDLLVLNKEDGVSRIINDTLLPEPLLRPKVENRNESGMLGIAATKNQKSQYVFLFYTELLKDHKNDGCLEMKNCKDETSILRNRLYRYELIDNKLTNPKLLLDLPPAQNSEHIGGALTIGPDDNLYVIIGEGDTCARKSCYQNRDALFWSKTSNVQFGWAPEGRGGILRVTPEGNEVKEDGILGKKYPLSLYYAYGIRNGFGIDFDPVSGTLWDTENGPGFGDEINMVEPGFNSGWSKVQGIWRVFDYESETKNYGWVYTDNNSSGIPEDLVKFNGKGRYSLPELVWNKTVGVTALKFLNSDKLGKQYENDLFVGDFKNGNIYNFDLNDDRKGLKLNGPLEDKVVNFPNETDGVIFGSGFGQITDIEVGPDGCMYVGSIWTNQIFKICHK